MISGTTILIVAAFVAIYYLFFKKDGNRKYPPGPIGLPLIGNLLSIGSRPHLNYTEMAKKYGGIFQANMGMTKNIVISDLDMMKEVSNDPIFSGRPDNKLFHVLAGGKHGVITSEGEEWLEQRRFTIRQLRDFGFGKKAMETLIMDEVHEILEWMKKEVGKPISLNRKFSLSILNSLWQILTGTRFNHDDPKLNSLFDTTTTTFNEIFANPVAVFFPSLAERFPGISGWNQMMEAVNSLLDFFRDTIKEHENNPADPDHPRDFIDVYFNEIRKTTKPESSFYKEKGARSLLAIVGDLQQAGSETTSTTLAWTILYLMKHPEVQRKLQAEIDRVVGKSRLPCLADKPSMPYTESLMYEILRITSIVPIGVFHNTMADTEFRGYFIPKDTMVTLNQYGILRDPKIWGDPETFRPERFLSKDGKTAIKHEALIPFGYGKRVCIGESLGKDEFFLFMTSIFQQFNVNPDPADPNPTFEPEVGFLLAPKKFKVVLKDRLN